MVKVNYQLEVNPKIKERLGVELEIIKQFCHQWGIVELALFGSILRDDFNLNSDIDILVSFEANNHISLLDLETLEQEVTKLLNRSVDIVTKKFIEKSDNWIRRHNILDNNEVIYVKR
ncbi:nucleotidyltransferase family protein [Crocosphaera sp.]|uniref:nucleotidyltransferase family protein n=1 Tax=Crocosphaera sp. TaxID=2729996 RepID=UPI003F20E3D1|nr:nucleotidyltransferase domain-containing protein [Crocosphaera sp.]